jgi:hypothetical protein
VEHPVDRSEVALQEVDILLVATPGAGQAVEKLMSWSFDAQGPYARADPFGAGERQGDPEVSTRWSCDRCFVRFVVVVPTRQLLAARRTTEERMRRSRGEQRTRW